MKFNADAFQRVLSKSARLSFAIKKIGNGKYRASRSSMKPVVKFLQDYSHVNINDIEFMKNTLNHLPTKSRTKYKNAIGQLIRRLDSIHQSLSGQSRALSRQKITKIHQLTHDVENAQAPLSHNEKLAIIKYKSPNGYREVNNALRGKTNFKEASFMQAKNIARGLRKFRRVQQCVFRGSGCLIAGVQKAIVGKIYTEPAFLSASMDTKSKFQNRHSICIIPKNNFFDIST
ncbi:MAG TPA: hypothetical protein EYO58_08740, partial [Flavobacteriales bacterium]|nr:hypothetical protein [Flavobacteriales bacterium]